MKTTRKVRRQTSGQGGRTGSYLDQVSGNGKHGNTSVLKLNKSESVELFLVTVGNEAKRIEESERGLGAQFRLESHVEGRARRLLPSRGESSGASDKGGENGRLHLEILRCV